jgi:SAM-dependent methyltransferase
MTDSMSAHVVANVERFMGFANTYDKYRPQPPTVLIDIFLQLAQIKRPHLVVDLGSGTGLSTRMWADRADAVIGIEPSADMRRIAEENAARMAHANVRYQRGYSHDTGLADKSVDIVTCSQSLHWMEPEPTFAEIARILRGGGIFAAMDCDWPPTMNWQAEDAYNRFDDECEKLGEARGFYRDVKQWDKSGHLKRMQASAQFRFTKEIVVHHTEMGNAERLVGLAMSQGGVATLLKFGLTEEEIGVPQFRATAHQLLGDEPLPWYFSYRVRYAIT